VPCHGATITTSSNPVELVQAILGEGVSLVGGATIIYSSGDQQGLFGDAYDLIGIDSGIVLSTGRIDGDRIFGPNIAPIESLGMDDGVADINTDLVGFSLPELHAIAGAETFDVNALSFYFSVENDATIYFNFVFASEEYVDHIGAGYNDVIAFFLDGENMALINGDPISINTINPLVNSDYYINNVDTTDGYTSAGRNIRFDGFTKVLRFEQQVSAGVHRITIAIADAFDGGVTVQCSFRAAASPHPQLLRNSQLPPRFRSRLRLL
jgi:hypothetical protein